ncbi:MAG: DoxX family protein [Myxococcales bacterium]|nr:DoxX family protein [Myxococcales bacterium]
MARPDTTTRRILRGLLGVFLVIQGINHFAFEAFFVRAMPGWAPCPQLLVQLSGIAEIALGVAVLVPRTRILAGWGIVALLWAVFPANIQMAMHPEQWPQVSATLLWARLPLQALFVVWAWACVLVVEPPRLDRSWLRR